MRRDYKVTLRTEESIATEALRWRELAGVDQSDSIDVATIIERVCRTELPGKGRPGLAIFEGEFGSTPAYVTFRPLVLHVEAETWDFARQDDPSARYVLAHELGHMVLHDHHPKAFATGAVKYNLYGLQDWSAEWQANMFADCFLLPDHVVRRHITIEDVMITCGVTRSLALRRWRRLATQHANRGELRPTTVQYRLGSQT